MATGKLTCCNAGHCLPLVVRKNGGLERLPNLGGMVLGVRVQTEYPVIKTNLARGERIVLYTDGLTEAHGPDDQEFGIDRLEAFLIQNQALDIDSLNNQLLNPLWILLSRTT